MFYIDELSWYLNLFFNVSTFYFVFYIGYYAGHKKILGDFKKDML